MTLTIEIEPEIESRLEQEAKSKGLEKEDFAKIIIEQNLSPKFSKGGSEMPGKSRYIGKVEMRDFSGDDQWLAENREKYQGKFVATHGNRLIAVGNGYKEIIKKARETGFPDALLIYIEPFDMPPFAGV